MHGAEIAWNTSIIDLTCITDDKKRGGQDEEEQHSSHDESDDQLVCSPRYRIARARVRRGVLNQHKHIPS